MPRKRLITVVTGSRAEFGLLLSVMRAIKEHRKLTLHTVVTGTHLTTGTWRDIVKAGITTPGPPGIDARVPMQKRGHVGREADVAALGRGVIGLGKTFAATRPDFVLMLGDRIEVMASAIAASVGGFRIAHMHGGDRAQGVADEAMRHAVSKLAHLHLPATVTSAKRLTRMGENPDCIFNVGSPAIDLLEDVGPLTPGPDGPQIILLQHPIGATDPQEATWFKQTYMAVRQMKQPFCVLGPNDDPGSNGIRAAASCKSKVELKGSRGQGAKGAVRIPNPRPLGPSAPWPLGIQHLSRDRFVAMLRGARCIVGNSSAGLIEAAALKIPAVNIGPRQAGRETPANVVDCAYGQANVQRAIRKAMRLDLRRAKHPYGNGQTGAKVADLLADVDLAQIPLRKCNSY